MFLLTVSTFLGYGTSLSNMNFIWKLQLHLHFFFLVIFAPSFLTYAVSLLGLLWTTSGNKSEIQNTLAV
jgi:hypothetical protein